MTSEFKKIVQPFAIWIQAPEGATQAMDLAWEIQRLMNIGGVSVAVYNVRTHMNAYDRSPSEVYTEMLTKITECPHVGVVLVSDYESPILLSHPLHEHVTHIITVLDNEPQQYVLDHKLGVETTSAGNIIHQSLTLRLQWHMTRETAA